MWCFSLAVLTVTLFAGSPVGAETHYSQILVGKWEGQVRFQASRANPSRILIIESVGAGESARPVQGKYGITGEKLGKMNGTLEISGGRPRLRFTTGANSNVVLELQGDKDLIGIIALPGQGERDMRLKKME